jgi:2-iminobutanoate/2-iminopropanoate deaminase
MKKTDTSDVPATPAGGQLPPTTRGKEDTAMVENNFPRPVKTEKAPAAIGPYSQAIAVNGFLFVSGQIPIDPDTGEMVTGSIEVKTHRVMKNLRAVAEAAGTDLARVVKTTIFLKDMDDFAVVNAAYSDYFEGPPPARSTIQVAALPKGADLEIEAVFQLPE